MCAVAIPLRNSLAERRTQNVHEFTAGTLTSLSSGCVCHAVQLAAWRQRKFDELNAPMSEGDKWVHCKVLQGQEHTFV